MKKALFSAVLCAGLLSVSGVAHAITVTWGANFDYGVATATGVPVPVGSLVLLGSFGNLTNAQIATASFATLQASFIPVNDASGTVRHIGDGSPASGGPTPTSADAGLWLDSNTNVTLTLGIAGKPIYYWVFNGTTMANSTQQGVFTAFSNPSAPIKANWTFKNDTDNPNTANTDLDNVLPYVTGRTGTVIDRNAIVIGNYGTGQVDGLPAYNLAPIPEPSSVVLLLGAVGVGSVLIRKRRTDRVA